MKRARSPELTSAVHNGNDKINDDDDRFHAPYTQLVNRYFDCAEFDGDGFVSLKDLEAAGDNALVRIVALLVHVEPPREISGAAGCMTVWRLVDSSRLEPVRLALFGAVWSGAARPGQIVTLSSARVNMFQGSTSLKVGERAGLQLADCTLAHSRAQSLLRWAQTTHAHLFDEKHIQWADLCQKSVDVRLAEAQPGQLVNCLVLVSGVLKDTPNINMRLAAPGAEKITRVRLLVSDPLHGVPHPIPLVLWGRARDWHAHFSKVLVATNSSKTVYYRFVAVLVEGDSSQAGARALRLHTLPTSSFCSAKPEDVCTSEALTSDPEPLTSFASLHDDTVFSGQVTVLAKIYRVDRAVSRASLWRESCSDIYMGCVECARPLERDPNRIVKPCRHCVSATLTESTSFFSPLLLTLNSTHESPEKIQVRVEPESVALVLSLERVTASQLRYNPSLHNTRATRHNRTTLPVPDHLFTTVALFTLDCVTIQDDNGAIKARSIECIHKRTL